MVSPEWFDLVDPEGNPVGRALRSECHGNPSLLHQAVHVWITNAAAEVFLQKRSMQKDIQPGKWDTSVGGHVDAGESPEAAVLRELEEEVGIRGEQPQYQYRYLWESEAESELIRSYTVTHEGPFTLQASEIDEGRFWTREEIEAASGTGIFTANFEFEWPRIRNALFG